MKVWISSRSSDPISIENNPITVGFSAFQSASDSLEADCLSLGSTDPNGWSADLASVIAENEPSGRAGTWRHGSRNVGGDCVGRARRNILNTCIFGEYSLLFWKLPNRNQRSQEEQQRSKKKRFQAGIRRRSKQEEEVVLNRQN